MSDPIRPRIDLEAFQREAIVCPLPTAIEMIGEKWAFLILRAALNGLQHFEEFQTALGIARNILSARLARLVEDGILDRTRDPDDGRKLIYALTDKGAALLPVVVALRQWSEQWDGRAGPIGLADLRDAQPLKPIRVESHDGRVLGLDDLMWTNRDTGESVSRASRPRMKRGLIAPDGD